MKSIGLIEVSGVVAAVDCLDIMCKSADVELVTWERKLGGRLVTVIVTGQVSAVKAAVEAAAAGKSCVAVILVRKSNAPYQCDTDVVDVAMLANHEKCIPSAWIDEENATMRAEFLEYARPLIQGELTPVYVDGLPCHLQKV